MSRGRSDLTLGRRVQGQKQRKQLEGYCRDPARDMVGEWAVKAPRSTDIFGRPTGFDNESDVKWKRR